MTLLYAILSIGAITTIYPFLVMISTGFKGATDQNDNAMIPKFWRESAELEKKYRDDKYAGDPSQIASTSQRPSAPSSVIAAYEKFLLELPLDQWHVAFRQAPTQVTSRLNQRYQSWLRDRFGTIEKLNATYIEENIAFQTVAPPAELYDRATWHPKPGVKYDDWKTFKRALPAEFRIPLRRDKMWQDFLRGQFQNQFASVPPEIKGSAPSFDQCVYSASGELATKFQAALPETLKAHSIEERWASIDSGPLPVLAYEKQFLATNAGEISREFSTRNYRYVLDYIVLNGRALWNTLIFCALAILLQLIVNPIAAYALSRYPMKSTGKILLFLLATMAFPAEVAMIPSFLLLRDIGLLNTFSALVLPAAASGFMIFLLKGFFDSLPQELYESGAMDGAKETTMLWKIALPLSKPVLGYLALLAFMGSYGAFMYAFLVAQDQRMWTLMVWIYQLQQGAPMAVTMAALTLAAIPTLVVFLAAQRVILRGIVLPGER